MAIVKIRRTDDYINRMREYRIFIDGKKVGTIGNGQTKDYNLPNGQHSVIFKIDWCSSPEYSFETSEKDSNFFLVGSLKSWRWMLPLGSIFVILSLLLNNIPYYIKTPLVLIPFFYILYYLTIGRKNYLTIEELKKS